MGNQIIKNLGFHHIALRCKNIEKSISMYEKLGLTKTASWGEGENYIAMFDIGDGGIIELFANGGDNYCENGRWQHFAMTCDNVSEAYEIALKAGFTSLTAPKKVPLKSSPEEMTIEVAFVLGPDNEQVEFFKKV